MRRLTQSAAMPGETPVSPRAAFTGFQLLFPELLE